MMDIFTDTPGSNVIVEQIQGTKALIRPDLRDTEGPWFYWRFRVAIDSDARERAVDIEFTQPNCLSRRGPAVSVDSGRNWSWLEGYNADSDGFDYTFPEGVDSVEFCTGIPYMPQDWDAFLDSLESQTPPVKFTRGELCLSRKGRPVPLLLAGRADARHTIILTSRHHCCEMTATHSLEGFLIEMLSGDCVGDGCGYEKSDRKQALNWMRENCRIIAVPFMDFDGVTDGDQGKNRRPHDHNRDYIDTPLYPETSVLMELVSQQPGDGNAVFMDLHCPWIRGQWNEHIYIVGSSDTDNWQRQCRLARILENAISGELPYSASDNLPFGESWNTTDAGLITSSARWMNDQPQISLATSFEIPYADVKGTPITAANARHFGADLAAAIAEYLKNKQVH